MGRRPPSRDIINIGGFSKYAKKVQSFTPMEAQLQALKEERQNVTRELNDFTKAVYPQFTDIPVSQVCPCAKGVLPHLCSCRLNAAPADALTHACHVTLTRSRAHALLTRSRYAPSLTHGSQASINVWGDAAWHSQTKKEHGSPGSYSPMQMNNPSWVRRQWGIDHQSHSSIPAHITTKHLEFAEKFAASNTR